jgi:hypothetical protein
LVLEKVGTKLLDLADRLDPKPLDSPATEAEVRAALERDGLPPPVVSDEAGEMLAPPPPAPAVESTEAEWVTGRRR